MRFTKTGLITILAIACLSLPNVSSHAQTYNPNKWTGPDVELILTSVSYTFSGTGSVDLGLTVAAYTFAPGDNAFVTATYNAIFGHVGPRPDVFYGEGTGFITGHFDPNASGASESTPGGLYQAGLPGYPYSDTNILPIGPYNIGPTDKTLTIQYTLNALSNDNSGTAYAEGNVAKALN